MNITIIYSLIILIKMENYILNIIKGPATVVMLSVVLLNSRYAGCGHVQYHNAECLRVPSASKTVYVFAKPSTIKIGSVYNPSI
jgi:hypothetical protein